MKVHHVARCGQVTRSYSIDAVMAVGIGPLSGSVRRGSLRNQRTDPVQRHRFPPKRCAEHVYPAQV